MVGVIGTIAKCAGPTFGAAFATSLTTARSPADPVSVQSADGNPLPRSFSRKYPVSFHVQPENFEFMADTTYDFYLYTVRSDRVCKRRILLPAYPFNRITYGLDESYGRRHRHCPEVGSNYSWLWHAPTSAPISKPSLLCCALRYCCCVLFVSNLYSFLQIAIYIRYLHSLGPLGLISSLYFTYNRSMTSHTCTRPSAV